MADIDELLKMLKSNSAQTRYDACEELRAMPTLPPEAVDALYPLTVDDDQNVADAAQRALAIHTETEEKNGLEFSDNKTHRSIWGSPLFWVLVLVVFPVCAYFIYLLSSCNLGC
jgi:hypothetical protein